MRRVWASTRWTWPILLAFAAFGQQYKADKAGPLPPGLPSDIAQALDQPGFQISSNGAPYCELWLRAKLPPGPPSGEPNVTLPIRPGTLLGVIRFQGAGTDRRGQALQPGVYTLRYGIMPMNDTHQGAAPQRDFLLLRPPATMPSGTQLPISTRCSG